MAIDKGIGAFFNLDDEAKKGINENVIRSIGKKKYKELINTKIHYKPVSELY